MGIFYTSNPFTPGRLDIFNPPGLFSISKLGNHILKFYVLSLNITTIMKGLVEYNIRATNDMNLKEIALQNNMGPADVYDLIKKIAETYDVLPRDLYEIIK